MIHTNLNRSNMDKQKISVDNLRTAIFGLEDALVSTTGVVVGIAASGADKHFILLASFIMVVVEAISMGAGQYLSAETVEEYKKKSGKHLKLIFGSFLMFVSYFFAGIVPIVPVVLVPREMVIVFSLLFSLCGLFAVGYLKGKFIKFHPLKSAFEMLVVGGLATVAGALVGFFLRV